MGFGTMYGNIMVKTYSDKSWVLGQCTEIIMGKKTFRDKAWVLGHERIL